MKLINFQYKFYILYPTHHPLVFLIVWLISEYKIVSEITRSIGCIIF